MHEFIRFRTHEFTARHQLYCAETRGEIPRLHGVVQSVPRQWMCQDKGSGETLPAGLINGLGVITVLEECP